MLHRLRRFFAATNTLEVDTPALCQFAVSDPQIASITAHSSLTNAPLFLHTSPEYCMKRLLAAGYPEIFSICRVFRDGETGHRHQPEFTIIEWYRIGSDLANMISDTLSAIAAALDISNMAQNVRILNYRDAFRGVLSLDPVDASIADLAAAADADRGLREILGNERDDWLDLLLTTKITPTFASDTITVLQHYPATQAALARICPADDAVADRFEVFFGSVELANGYVELTDANEQARRFARDQQQRARRNRPVLACDTALLSALETGLPDCAGVAMGLERLQMIHDQTNDIADVVTFAFEGSK
jgi:lysyl-tRNA synthetase class 2